MPLTPTKLRWNNQNRFGKELKKNLTSDPETGRNFPGSMSFEVNFAELKLTDKVPLTPGNVHTKFRLNKENVLGEKCKILILDPQNGRHFPRSKSFENSRTRCPLPLAMSLPSCIGINKVDLEKSAKM